MYKVNEKNSCCKSKNSELDDNKKYYENSINKTISGKSVIKCSSNSVAHEKIQYIIMIFQSYYVYFQYSNLLLISFFDILSAEMISTMAIFTPNKDYASYVVTSTVYGLVQCINMSYSVCSNVNIGYFIGKGDYIKGREYFYYILIQTNLLMFIACAICYYYQNEFVLMLTEPGQLLDDVSNLYLFTLLINMQDSTFSILLNTLKTLNENNLALNIMISYNIINGVLMYMFAFGFELNVQGLYYGYILSDLLVLLVLIFIFYKKIDWVSQTKSSIEFLESNEKIIQKLESHLQKE